MFIVYWTMHVQMFAMFETADSTIASINFICMFSVSIIPFTVSLVQNWHDQFYTSLLINGNLVCITICMLIIWLYASWKRKFVFKDINTDTIRKFTLRLLLSPIFYVLSIAIAPVNNYISLAISLIIPLNFIVLCLGLDIVGLAYDSALFIIQQMRSKHRRAIINEEPVTEPITNTTPSDFLESETYHTRVLDRVKAFSDNVFGITITLMVLKLATPDRMFKANVSPVNSTLTNSTWNVWEWNAELGRKLVDQTHLDSYLYNIIAFVVVCDTNIVYITDIDWYMLESTYILDKRCCSI
jgi:uncharacterized membrane protein